MGKKPDKKSAKQKRKKAKSDQKEKLRQHRRKAEAVLSRQEVADQLRALASQVEGGTFVLGDKELELPAQAGFEIIYKPKKRGGHQIEVEIEWGRSDTVTLLPTE